MSDDECREWVLHYDQADGRGIPFSIRRCGDADEPRPEPTLLARELKRRADEMQDLR